MAEVDVLSAMDAYIRAKETGTAMLVFADNSLGRIYMEAGAAVSARYRNLEGVLAMEQICTRDVRTVKFHAGTDIVQSMERLTSGFDIAQPAQDPGDAADSAAATASPAGPALSPSSRQILQQLLSGYIGPVAALVVDDLAADVDVETALSTVAKEIDDPQQSMEFVIAARQIVT